MAREGREGDCSGGRQWSTMLFVVDVLIWHATNFRTQICCFNTIITSWNWLKFTEILTLSTLASGGAKTSWDQSNRSFLGLDISKIGKDRRPDRSCGLYQSSEFPVLTGLGPVQSQFFCSLKTGLPSTSSQGFNEKKGMYLKALSHTLRHSLLTQLCPFF